MKIVQPLIFLFMIAIHCASAFGQSPGISLQPILPDDSIAEDQQIFKEYKQQMQTLLRDTLPDLLTQKLPHILIWERVPVLAQGGWKLRFRPWQIRPEQHNWKETSVTSYNDLDNFFEPVMGRIRSIVRENISGILHTKWPVNYRVKYKVPLIVTVNELQTLPLVMVIEINGDFWNDTLVMYPEIFPDYRINVVYTESGWNLDISDPLVLNGGWDIYVPFPRDLQSLSKIEINMHPISRQSVELRIPDMWQYENPARRTREPAFRNSAYISY
ncbi:MAG: hypothetical protein HQM12_00910 [SAR324 cluster bacterium]|nr:hypothetical protein [SAR324 cluster bacterium]